MPLFSYKKLIFFITEILIVCIFLFSLSFGILLSQYVHMIVFFLYLLLFDLTILIPYFLMICFFLLFLLLRVFYLLILLISLYVPNEQLIINLNYSLILMFLL